MNARTGLLLAAAALLSGPSLAVQDTDPPARQKAPTEGSSVDAAFKLGDDPRIPTPGDLTPATPARLFVESFLVGLAARTPVAVYQTYLDAGMRAGLAEDKFTASTLEMRQALGPLQRLVVSYLREEHAGRGRPGRGYAKYVLVFEKEPRVDARVDFQRDEGGLWRVIDYGMASPVLDGLSRARANAARDAEAPAQPGTEKAPPAAPPAP